MPKLTINEDFAISEPEEDKRLPKKECAILSRIMPGVYVAIFLSVLIGVSLGLPTLFEALYTRRKIDKYIGVCSIKPHLMVECFPGVGEVNIDTCLKWDCCWREEMAVELRSVSAPRCYHRLPSSYRLMVSDEQVEKVANTTLENDLQFPLQLHTYQSSLSTNWIRQNQLLTAVYLSVLKTSSQLFKLQFSPNSSLLSKSSAGETTDVLYDVKAVLADTGCVDIFVQRIETGRRIFSLNCVGALVITQTYTEMTILLPPGSALYGLGFVNKNELKRSTNGDDWMLLSNMSYFDKDSSLYGAHPQYLCVEPDGKAHGVIFNTGQVLRVSLLSIPALVIRTAGPIVDVYIALGPRPADVVSQLTDITGLSERPALPPFWALGYHLCPEGKVDYLQLMRDLKKHDIPLASHCLDSSILQELIFEDEEALSKRSDLQDALSEMKQNGVKLLGVTFPQLAINKTMSKDMTYAFDTGVDMSIFLESNFSEFWGDVSVAYLDPTHPEASTWMKKVLTHLSTEANINFDGYILHWNTPLDLRNFTENPCSDIPLTPLQSNFENVCGPTLCPEVLYHNGQTHKQVGNKYGHLHTAMMAKALVEDKPKRSFLLSLASFTGTGHFGGVWGGLYYSNWESLQQSILYVQEASIYGIPLSGVPICGHLDKAEIDLCARWFQAGAFYPLALSFYNENEKERNPLAFDEAFTLFAARVLKLRYSLLPYLYTLFYNAHKHGTPVMTPLFFEFPQYKQTISEMNVFLWGKGLLFIPCVQKKKMSVTVWLPNVDWYEFYSGVAIEMPEEVTDGKWVTIPAPMYNVNVFIRGGHVIFTQAPHTSIAGTRKSAYTVYVGLDRRSLKSRGYLVIDDGESIGGPELHVVVEVANDSMIVDAKESNGAFAYLQNKEISTDIDHVRLYGIEGTVGDVEVDTNRLETGTLAGQFLFSAGVLNIHYKMQLNVNHVIKWTVQ